MCSIKILVFYLKCRLLILLALLHFYPELLPLCFTSVHTLSFCLSICPQFILSPWPMFSFTFSLKPPLALGPILETFQKRAIRMIRGLENCLGARHVRSSIHFNLSERGLKGDCKYLYEERISDSQGLFNQAYKSLIRSNGCKINQARKIHARNRHNFF